MASSEPDSLVADTSRDTPRDTSRDTSAQSGGAPEFAIVGRVRKPQGIAGELTVELLTDEPEKFFADGRRLFAGTVDGDIAPHPADRRNPDSRQELTVEYAKPFREGLIVKFDQIPDRSASELWRQRYLLVPMCELTPPEENEVFLHDLIGMRVRTETGTEMGTVVALYEMPQGLTLDVKGAEKGSEILIPYRPAVVQEVDLDARVILVDSTCGLFD